MLSLLIICLVLAHTQQNLFKYKKSSLNVFLSSILQQSYEGSLMTTVAIAAEHHDVIEEEEKIERECPHNAHQTKQAIS